MQHAGLIALLRQHRESKMRGSVPLGPADDGEIEAERRASRSLRRVVEQFAAVVTAAATAAAAETDWSDYVNAGGYTDW